LPGSPGPVAPLLPSPVPEPPSQPPRAYSSAGPWMGLLALFLAGVAVGVETLARRREPPPR
ncbi:MAG: hypothetical protein QGG40_12705, partial [Myxococcota bacterium]|nr:hypothetical protein [Myxococcota bacterium]